MKTGLAFASALALFAAPLAAQEVPLNTISGGAGTEQVVGQVEAGVLAGLGGTVTVTTAAIVVSTIALVAVAADESSTTTD